MKQKIIPILCIFLLVLSGCSTTTSQQTVPDPKYFRTGTKALEFTFIRDAPPGNVWIGDEFPITIQLQNQGAADISGGIIALGVETNYIDLLSIILEDKILKGKDLGKVVFNLNGKSINYPEGEISIIEIMAKAKKISLAKFQDSTILFTACYNYDTIAETEVCLENSQAGYLQLEKGCKAKDISLSSQGGPIAIKNIEVRSQQTTKGRKNIFRITLKNLGRGQIVKPLSKELSTLCSAGGVPDRRIWDRFFVKAYLSGKPLTCKPLSKEKKDSAIIQLKNNEGIMICEILTSNTGSYLAPLRIEAEYGYVQTGSKTIKLERLGLN